MDQRLIQDGAGSYGSTDSTLPDVSVEGPSSSTINFDSVVSNIYSINSNCRFLEQAAKAIGSTKDNIKLRNNVQSTLLSTKNLIDKTKSELHDLIQLSRRQEKSFKLQVEKLKNSFKDAVQVFSGLQNVLLLKLKRNLPSEPCPITHSEHKRVDYIYDDEEELLSLQQTFQKTLEENLEEITEREDILHKLENDVKDVNDIMRDLGTLIHSQGDTVDRIEDVIEDVHGNVEGGRQELEKAAEYQQKRKKKLFYLFVILFVAVLCLVGVLYYTLRQ